MLKRFFLHSNRRTHLLRHMQESELAGSHFYPEVFETPEALIDFINENEPSEVIQQREKRFAYCFASNNDHPVGTLGLISSFLFLKN